MVKDVIMKDPTASSLIGEGSLLTTKVNVVRFKQSLDDPQLIFWRPWNIIGGEWPFIFFLKLGIGKLVANSDLGPSV